MIQYSFLLQLELFGSSSKEFDPHDSNFSAKWIGTKFGHKIKDMIQRQMANTGNAQDTCALTVPTPLFLSPRDHNESPLLAFHQNHEHPPRHRLHRIHRHKHGCGPGLLCMTGASPTTAPATPAFTGSAMPNTKWEAFASEAQPLSVVLY